MKQVPVEESVGMVLCHDITQIVPGEFKGPAFCKGHIIQPEDIPVLKSLGKYHLFVWECSPGFLHENEAAVRLAAAVSGPGVECTKPKEGKVNLLSTIDGLLIIKTEAVHRINAIPEIVLATRHNYSRVSKGDIIAGTRVVPLTIPEERIVAVEEKTRMNAPVVEVRPFRPRPVGLVTTGREIYEGLIPDKFAPVLEAKLQAFGCAIQKQLVVPDDLHQIAKAVKQLRDEGVELILATGGMSVDPDDLTPGAIRQTGAEIVTYGVPVLPGSMFLLAYMDGIPVMGLPGCVMYMKTSIFDLVLPRILADIPVTRDDLTRLGVGGLCLSCEVCHYPICPFGTSN